MFFIFWSKFFDKINSAAISEILGIKELQAIYPRIEYHAGDDPAQLEVAGIKCGSNVNHGCIQCMYVFREGAQYKPLDLNLRDLAVVQNIIECEEIFGKQLKGVKCSKEESQ